MISWEAFSTDFAQVSALVERRRKRHLLFFYFAAIMIVAAWVAVFCHPSGDAAGEEGMRYYLWNLMRDMRHGVGLFFLILGSMAWIFIPIYHYRGMNGSAALKPPLYQHFSLKDDVYSKLLRLFGPVEFAPRGGVSLLETRKSTLFPAHTLRLSEDYIVARLHDMEVKLSESDIVRIEDGKRIALFKGLLLVCDISEVKIKLRSGFKGRTALINDQQKNVAAIVDRYAGMKKFPLPEKFEPLLEGYTTDAAEAQAIVTAELLGILDAFAQQAKQLKQQVERWDDRLAYAASALYDFCKDKFIAAGGKSELPAEKAYNAMYDTDLDMTKADPVSNDISSLNSQFELEFYEDKFIVTIPCISDLFELGSLFEPALNEEDARFLYGMMQCLDKVTEHLSQLEP